MVVSTEQIAQLALAPGPSRWNKSSCRILKKKKTKTKCVHYIKIKKKKKRKKRGPQFKSLLSNKRKICDYSLKAIIISKVLLL